MNENNIEFYLVFVHCVGENSNGSNTYELFFAKDQSMVFGPYWHILPIGICSKNEKFPHESTIDLKKTIKTKISLKLSQNNGCVSMMDVMDDILALCWEDISMLEDYPDYRLVLHYGEPISEVEYKLNKKGILYEKEN